MAKAAAVVSPQGRSCLFPQDLSMAINTLLFVCAAKPGLSRVLMSLYNFEGTTAPLLLFWSEVLRFFLKKTSCVGLVC
jgi:hypothetical protein